MPQLQLPMTSVTNITKERTAMIIPNAVAVFTDQEKHLFTSFISRDHTFTVATQAWRRALASSSLHTLVTPVPSTCTCTCSLLT